MGRPHLIAFMIRIYNLTKLVQEISPLCLDRARKLRGDTAISCIDDDPRFCL